ncbi:MAG TPA: fumarylacetoacetate hydrolase family protein [Chthoniobacteraceae bacterium]
MPLPPVTVFRSASGLIVQIDDEFRLLRERNLDALFTASDPAAWLHEQLATAWVGASPVDLHPPVQSQEIWAAGVTYMRSREARVEESQDTGGGTFYDRVYDAERPEIFFKATPHRAVGHGGRVALRSDSHWNVPEPEVALAINSAGQIFGYTIGNDMSSRDIEGENPLYLPQAKVYRACCGLGPGIVVREPLPRSTGIAIEISRNGQSVFDGATTLERMKRNFTELASYLYRDNDFPYGSFLLTGTGIVPPNDFTLEAADEIRISVAGLGTLFNIVG